MEYEINLGLIKKKRKKKGLSLQEMARVLGFKNASTYLKYETGEYSFKLDMLPILSEKLEIPFESFFTHDISETEIREKDKVK